MLRLGLWRVVYDDDGLAFSVEVWVNWDVGVSQEPDILSRQGAGKDLERLCRHLSVFWHRGCASGIQNFSVYFPRRSWISGFSFLSRSDQGWADGGCHCTESIE